MRMVFNSGSTLNPVGKEGLAGMTANMLMNGTKTRSATDISNSMQSIGASMNVNSSWDSTGASLQTLTKHLDKALDVYSDVLRNPSFPEKELKTLQQRTLIGFRQRKDNPTAIANLAYSKLLYGKDHPYGRPQGGDEKSVAAITRADLVKFYGKFYRPNNATLVVVGDVSKEDVMKRLEKRFGSWKAGEKVSAAAPKSAEFANPGIYIIDKPGAAQSELRIGHVGVERNHPDYIPILVMNHILGGQFSARVNLNLREDKGYTYGARTSFSFRKGAGPFTASAGVQTAVTKESVMEFMKEIKGIQGAIPVSKAELEYSKQSLIRRFPRQVETVGQMTGQLSSLYVYGLSDDYANDYLKKIAAVSLDDVKRVANTYLKPDKMAIVVVGDKATIAARLSEIDGWGSRIAYLDTDGNPIVADE